MQWKRFVLACVAALLLTGCGSAAATVSVPRAPGAAPGADDARAKAAPPGLWSYTVRSGGRTRSYLLYVPPGYTARHPLPLVLVYPGFSDSAVKTTTMMDLLAVDEVRHNMLLAYMQGYENSWNAEAGATPAALAHIDESAFTIAALRKIESVYAVDRRRVIAAGFSNGALVDELFGCRIAQYLTLIVPIEGEIPASISPGCHPSKPISVYEIHATGDALILYAGGLFAAASDGTTVLSAPASIARWASLDGCRSRAADEAATADESPVVLRRYVHCRGSVLVELESIQGGAHQWPNAFGELVEKLAATMPTNRTAVGTAPAADVTRR